MSNQVNLSVGFDVDKGSLSEIYSSLKSLQKLTAGDILKISPNLGEHAVASELREIKNAAEDAYAALKLAFNTDLNTLNISRFNDELKKVSRNGETIYGNGLTDLKVKLEKAGFAGTDAFRKISTGLLTTSMGFKQTNKLVDEMWTTFKNTAKWGVTSSAFNAMANSVQKAWTYSKSLNTTLNDIRIVTDKSAESMEKFAKQANQAAKNLGSSTRDYSEASLIYYQQGLSDTEVAERTETTIKTANVTGQNAEEVSEQLTAIWNGYKVSADEAEVYIDKVAAVAATTAADLEEMATGMSKVASAANIMGVDIDQLNGILATVVSVTRQAPESVGTAFKTIFSRL